MIKTSKKKLHFSPVYVVLFAVLLLYVFSMLYVLLWGVMTSFKDYAFEWMMTDNYNALPKKLNFDNYKLVFSELSHEINVVGQMPRTVGIGEMLWNSLIYVFGCSFFATFTPCVVAYVTSRFDLKINKFIYATVIIAMSLPIVGALPSEMRMAKILGLWNNPIGLWLMSMTYLSVYYLVFYATFKGIPAAYTEAALVDGAGNFRIFISIMLPMVKGAFFTIFLMFCISYWNNYQTPLIYLPSWPTIAVGLYDFGYKETAYREAPYQTAAAILTALPIIIVFMCFADRIMGRISMGGIKE